MRLDTTVGTFLGPPFGSTATKYLKRWFEEGTDTGIEAHDMLLAQQLVQVLVLLYMGAGICHMDVGIYSKGAIIYGCWYMSHRCWHL